MKMPSASKVLELAVIGVLLAGTAWLGQLTYHNYVVHGSAALLQANTTAPVDLPVTSLTGEAVDFQIGGRERALVFMVLSTECPYCEQNMPEWRKLVESVRGLGPTAPEIIALSVSPAGETREFLRSHGIDVPALLIDGSVLTLLGLHGYPSTVVVDPATRQMASWSGVLRDAEQRAVLSWSRSEIADLGQAEASRSGND